jgi:hypothetical protein
VKVSSKENMSLIMMRTERGMTTLTDKEKRLAELEIKLKKAFDTACADKNYRKAHSMRLSENA